MILMKNSKCDAIAWVDYVSDWYRLLHINFGRESCGQIPRVFLLAYACTRSTISKKDLKKLVLFLLGPLYPFFLSPSLLSTFFFYSFLFLPIPVYFSFSQHLSMSFFSILPDTFSFSFLQFVREGAHQHSVALECVCFSRSLKGEATLVSVASSWSSRWKTNTQRLCTFCLNAWNKVPSCRQHGWGGNVFYNKLSHVLTYTFSVTLFPIIMLIFAASVSDWDIFHNVTFLLIGMFIWRIISVQGRTDPLETQLYIRTALQVSGVPFLFWGIRAFCPMRQFCSTRNSSSLCTMPTWWNVLRPPWQRAM